MAVRDLHNNIAAENALDSTAISSDTTTNGEIIDTRDYESVEFLIKSETLTDGTYTPSITEGDEDDLSDGSAVVAADLLGTIAAATFAAADDNAVKKIGYSGTKRYVRLNITSASTTSGGTLSAVVVKGHPALAAVA